MPRSSFEKIDIVSEINSNQNTATHLDFIFVYDEKLLAFIPQSSIEWFASKDVMMNSVLLIGADVIGYELPPGKVEHLTLSDKQRKALTVFCFASYAEPNQIQRIRLPSRSLLEVRLSSNLALVSTR